MKICPLCNREVLDELFEKHHLQTRKKSQDSIEEICQACHRTIHVLFRDSDLRNPTLELDSIEGLLSNERFAKSLIFIKKQPAESSIKVRESFRKKRRK